MQFLPNASNTNFLRWRKKIIAVSGIVMLISLISVTTRGMNLGIDFTGGTLMEIGYQNSVDLNEIRNAMANGGFTNAVVQHFGTTKDVLIRTEPQNNLNSAELSTKMMALLKTTSSSPLEMRRIEFVGPQVGDELVEKGGLAMLIALGTIFIYVWIRFEKRFSLGSIAALIHDVIITLGIFSIFQLEFDLTVLAAILAVMGYSINDTIVVFDRVRENFRTMRTGSPEEIINISINQTLSRTIMTSFTTLVVLIALFLFGGELIHGFATALIIGIMVGTYSSIYIAASVALMLGASRQDLMPPEKEGVG